MEHSKDRGVWKLFVSCLLWNICNGMLFVLTPLYGVALGLPLIDISTLVGLPYLATVVVRFGGGVIADKFGEHRMLLGCYLCNLLAAACLSMAGGFVSLLLSSTLANLSRSTFWVPAQSMASQLSADNPGRGLGRLSAANYSGQLLGLSLGGVFAGFLGYVTTFLIVDALALICVAVGVFVPAIARKPSARRIWQIVATIGRGLGRAHTWLVISASAAAAVPFALTSSLYPVYMSELDFPQQWIGPAVALRSLGPVFTGLLLGSLVTMHRERVLYALGMAGLGAFVLGSAGSGHLLVVGLCIAGLGMAGGLMDLLNQVQAVALSHARDRSAMMAATGLGWNISPMVLPILLGWLAETQGFRMTFVVAGAFFFAVALGTPVLYRLVCPLGSEANG